MVSRAAIRISILQMRLIPQGRRCGLCHAPHAEMVANAVEAGDQLRMPDGVTHAQTCESRLSRMCGSGSRGLNWPAEALCG